MNENLCRGEQKRLGCFDECSEAIASTMEHAIKHAIDVKMNDNPIHYTSLWERLMKILEETNMNWEERRKQLEEFIEREMSHSEEDLAKKLGLKDNRQLAIFETVQAEMKKQKVAEAVVYYSGYSEEDAIKKITLDIEEVILKTRVKGFKHNPTRISEMETELYNMLMIRYFDALGVEVIPKLAGDLVDLAKIHYGDME